MLLNLYSKIDVISCRTVRFREFGLRTGENVLVAVGCSSRNSTKFATQRSRFICEQILPDSHRVPCFRQQLSDLADSRSSTECHLRDIQIQVYAEEIWWVSEGRQEWRRNKYQVLSGWVCHGRMKSTHTLAVSISTSTSSSLLYKVSSIVSSPFAQ